MKKNTALSRANTYKKVKSILNAQRADMSLLTVQCTPRSTSLQGELLKIGGDEFQTQEVAKILDQIILLTPSLSSDLINWNLNGSSIEKK